MNQRTVSPSQETLQSGWHLAKLCGWSFDVASGRFNWSSETDLIFNFSEAERSNPTLAAFLRHIHPDDRKQFEEIVHHVLSKGLPSFSYRYRIPEESGGCKFIVGHAQCEFADSGKVQRVYGSIMDVSEQERRRKAAELVDVRIRAMSASGKVWWWEQDADFRFTAVTATSDKELSTTHAANIGLRRWETPDSQPCQGTWEDHRRVVEARQPFHDFEYRIGERYISVTGLAVHSEAGQFLGYRGTAHNITAQKHAEAQARENLALLHLASRLGRVGAWVVELPSMRVSWSADLLDIYELPADAPLSAGLLMSLVEPGAREALRKSLRQCREEGVPADIEFPSSTVKGSKVWLRLTAEAVYDVHGAIVRVQGAVQDITDRKQDEQRLHQLSTELLTTFESITDAFLTADTDLRLTYVNREAERLTKQTREELIGHRIPDLFPWFRGTSFHAELARVRETGSVGRAEAYLEDVRKWLNVTLYPSVQGIALIVRDVTASHNAHRALALSEEKYRLLFETSADGIVKVSPDGRIEHANRAACKMFGRTLEQMQGLISAQLVSANDARLESMVDERLRTGGAFGELSMVRQDGSTFDAEVSSSTYTSSVGEKAVTIVFRDATERVRLRRKLEALNDELAQRVHERTAELERANSELKGFARSLAHDLRQPIAGAKSLGIALGAALATGDIDRASSYAAQVVAANKNMSEYVEALLSLARISQASLEIEEVDLSAMASALFDELQRESPGRRVACSIQPQMYADGDATLLRLLLQNLLGNAFKFTGRKSRAEITLYSELASDGRIVYCVRDNGVGFDAAQAHRLFGTFQRLHRQADFPGTGIGLANAKRIVERHGGTIWAASDSGRGTSFMFTLGESIAVSRCP